MLSRGMISLRPWRRVWLVLSWALLHLGAMSAKTAASDTQFLAYIGTYTGPKSQGIYVARFDAATGKLSSPELAAAVKNPSFLVLDPKRPFLYAVSEMDSFNGQKTGAVSGFRIEASTGKLTLLNQRSSGGAGPTHLAVDREGKCVLVANYGSGSVAVLPLAADGSLEEPSARVQHRGTSVNRERQAGPHAHFITTDPANRFALTCDLGLDKVLVYQLDAAKGLLTPNDPPAAQVEPGSGPRHLAFDPHGRFAYLINEMTATLTVFDYDAKNGTLKEVQTCSTLPDGFSGFKSGAEVQVHPSGKFVYASNRGHDSLAAFAIDRRSGRVKLVGHQSAGGKTPRHFALDPTGKWLLAENQDSDSIVVFRVDMATGGLSPAGQTVTIGSPVCVVFAPAP
jgi:6-phosphogluconolactonase